MSPDREMIALAVLEGKLPESMLTSDEVDEILLRVQEAIMEKTMNELYESGKSVFWGVDSGDSVH